VRIVLSNLFFGGLTGSEISSYELAKELAKRGHDVIVTPLKNKTPFLTEKVEALGVSVQNLDQIDMDFNPDILICGQAPVAKITLKIFPGVPAVEFVRSEFQEIEPPLLNKRIKKYICNRPSVQEKVIASDKIKEEDTVVIWNGVDYDRFDIGPPDPNRQPKRVVFVGGANHIRIPAMKHLVEMTREKGWIAKFVSSGRQDFMNESHVEVVDGGWDIEKVLEDSDYTAGILFGRTTIEGLVAQRPGYIYQVDWGGNIHAIDYVPVPPDRTIFSIETHTDEVLGVIDEVLTME